MSNVILHITSKIDNESIKQIKPGKITFNDKGMMVSYNDATLNYIRVSENKGIISRPDGTKIVVEKGVLNICPYYTQFGRLDVEVFGKKVIYNNNKIHLEYTISDQNAKIIIEIKEENNV